MNRFSRRFLAAAIFVATLFLPLACDSKSGSTSSGESIATNFGISLKSVVATEGMPDSVVAVVSMDGVAVDTVVPGLSGLVDSTLRFPVDAPEGSKVSVTYQMYKGDGVIAAGQVTWVSGEAVYIPRPNIAPRVSIRNAEADAIVRRKASFVLRTESSDPENKSRELQIDWDGDGTFDHSVVPPTGRDSVLLSWDKAGTYVVSTWVKDDQGLRRRDTLSVRVLPVATIRLSQDTTVSVGDSVDVLVSMSYDDPSQAPAMSLFWSVVGDTSTTMMTPGRRFAWSKPGKCSVVVNASDAVGEASRDTMVITVVQDAPKLDLDAFPAAVNLGGVATLPIGVEQSFGTIVRWGMNFHADTASGWDTTGTALVSSVQHMFARSGDAKIIVFVEDDDGNRTVASGNVSVSAAKEGAVLRRVSSQDTAVSLGDSATLRFLRSFPEGLESSSRMEWMVDGNACDTTTVVLSRSFAWSTAGSHKVAWRLATPIGSTSWDTVNVVVESDVPELVLSSFLPAVDRNTIAKFAPKATDRYGSIVRWGMDFDGDTATGWDTTAQGEPTEVMHVFSALDTARKILVFVEDDDGNRVVKSHLLKVVSGSELLSLTSKSTPTVSIGDTVLVTFQDKFAVEGTRSASRLVWKIDDLVPETLAVSTERSFLWNEPGEHVLRYRVVGGFGGTAWDSVVVQVVQGEPRIVSISRSGSGVGKRITFAAESEPNFGTIVRVRWDFGDDGVWDDSSDNSNGSVERAFATSAPASIRVQVRDDDGNVDDTVFVFSVHNAAPAFGTVDFADDEVGVMIATVLEVPMSDSDGTFDLVALKIDWNGDGNWDTTRTMSGLASVQLKRAWTDSGTKTVRLLLLDRSGDSALATASVHVASNPPSIRAIQTAGKDSVARIGDTLRFVASIADSSLVADLDYALVFQDGVRIDSVSLRGRSVYDMPVPVASRTVGKHVVRVDVRDLVGNADRDSAYWRVVAAPPRVKARLNDSILIAGDSAFLMLDSLAAGARGGSVASVSWMYKGASVWTQISSPLQGGTYRMTLPVSGRDSAWTLVVRATQDNGEVGYDTVAADLLESFVDARDGRRYPVVTIGGVQWMGRNLHWKPTVGLGIAADCPDGFDCEKTGFGYSHPYADVNGMISDGKSLGFVCPDGWRLPDMQEWTALDSAAKVAFPALATSAQRFRARDGWTTRVVPQNDPLRFAAYQNNTISGAEAYWWTFRPGVPTEQHAFFADDDMTVVNNISTGRSHAVRCVRNTRIIIDTAWKAGVRIGVVDGNQNATFRALVPDGDAPVSVTISVGGVSNNAIVSPAVLREVKSLALPVPPRVGPNVFTLRMEQSGVVAQDTFHYVVLGRTGDHRYMTTRIGGRIWMAENVNVDTVVYASGADQYAGFHYTLDAVFGGTAPASGPTAPAQGICPDGMHIPSKAEWQAMFDSVTAQGLTPQNALRKDAPGWSSSLPTPSDNYGFSALPEGRSSSGTWDAGGYFWAADADGYSMVTFDNGFGTFMINGPTGRAQLVKRALSLRCIAD